MKKKKFSCRILSLLLAVALLGTLLTACGGKQTPPPANTAPAQTTPAQPGDTGTGGLTTTGQNWELSATCHDPATSVKTLFIQEWASRVKDVTAGQVNITTYPGATLAASTAALEAMVTGAVDVAWVFTSFFPNQFPLTDVVTLPMLGIKDVPQATNVLWDLYDWSADMQKELSDEYKMIMLYTNPPNHLSTATKEVKSLETIKGVQYRAPSGAITDILTLWGAVPIMMGPPDVYEALEKKVIDGYAFEYSGLADFNLQEVTKYYMDMPIYVGPFLLLMNKDVWNAFPADIQAAIDSVSDRDCSLEMAQIFQEDYDTKRNEVLSREGAVLTQISEADYAAFKAVADEYNNGWAAKISEKGIDGKAFLDKAIEFVQKYA